MKKEKMKQICNYFMKDFCYVLWCSGSGLWQMPG